jgi:hypothetical protein
MKAFIAALIASAILYVADSEYNQGRYAAVIQRAATSLIAG